MIGDLLGIAVFASVAAWNFRSAKAVERFQVLGPRKISRASAFHVSSSEGKLRPDVT
jgi:hypothetical protein